MSPRSKRLEQRVASSSGTVTPARSAKTKRLARQGSESQLSEDLSKSFTYKNSNRTPKLKDTIKPLSQSMKKPVTDGATRKSRRLHLFENASASGSDIEPQAIPSRRKSVRKIDVDENVSKTPAPKTPRKSLKTLGKTQNVRQKEAVSTPDGAAIATSSRKSARKTKTAQNLENASTDRDTTSTMLQQHLMDTDENKTSSDEMQTSKKSKKIRKSKKLVERSVTATDDEMIAQEDNLAVKRKPKGRKSQKTLIQNSDSKESEGLTVEESGKMEPLKPASKSRRVTKAKAGSNESPSSGGQKDNNEHEQEVNVANSSGPKNRKSQRNLLTRSEDSQESDTPAVGKFVKKKIAKSSAKRRRNRTVKTDSPKPKGRKSLTPLFTSSDDIQEAECSVVNAEPQKSSSKRRRDETEKTESDGNPSTSQEEQNQADENSSSRRQSSKTTNPNNDETHENLLEKEPKTFDQDQKEDFMNEDETEKTESDGNQSTSQEEQNHATNQADETHEGLLEKEPQTFDQDHKEEKEDFMNEDETEKSESDGSPSTPQKEQNHATNQADEKSSSRRLSSNTTKPNNDETNEDLLEKEPQTFDQDQKEVKEDSTETTEIILESQVKLEVTCDLNATFDKDSSLNVSDSENDSPAVSSSGDNEALKNDVEMIEIDEQTVNNQEETLKNSPIPKGRTSQTLVTTDQSKHLEEAEVESSLNRSALTTTTNKESSDEEPKVVKQNQKEEVSGDTIETILEPEDKLEVTCDLNATFDKSASNASNSEVEEVDGAASEMETEDQNQNGAQLEQHSSLKNQEESVEADVISSTKRPSTETTKADSNDTHKDSLDEASTNLGQEHSLEKDVCAETTEIILESQDKLEVTCDADTTFDKSPSLNGRDSEVVQVEEEAETKSEVVSSSFDNKALQDDEIVESAKQITANLDDLEKFYDANQNVSSTVHDQSISDSTFECAEDESIISVDSYGSIIVLEDTPKPAIKEIASKAHINSLPQAKVRPLSSTPLLLSSNVSSVKKDVKRLQGKTHTPMNRCRSIAERESTPHVKTFRLSKKVETSISKLAQEEFAQIVKDRPPPRIISAESKLLKSIRKRSLSTSDADISKSIAKNKVTFHSPSNLTIPIEDIDKSLMIYQKSATKPENTSNLSRKRTHSVSVVGSGVKLARAESEGDVLRKHKKLERQPSRTKMPNFSAIHKNKFEKMESIVDHVRKKEEMAKALSASKAKQDSVHRSAKKVDENIKELTSQNVVPQLVKNTETSTRNPKAKQKINLTHIPVERNDKTTAEEEVPKPEVKIAVVTPIPIKKVDKVIERRKKNESMFKARSRKDVTITKGNEIVKGVRSNRRFELQMLHRNKK